MAKGARMSLVSALRTSPVTYLQTIRPDHPVLFFSPAILQATARRFCAGFPGLVTYAVKANDAGEVLDNLIAAGISTFDVASPHEMEEVRTRLPNAVLHYNNPVRSEEEVRIAVRLGVASYSVDGFGELAKLARCGVPAGTEVAVRYRLPVKSAAYDFGAKFGADPDEAAAILARVSDMGFRPSMTFHPGTQCADPSAWATYIDAAGRIARRAGLAIDRLNVGGGYAAHRGGAAPDLDAIFRAIAEAVGQAFPGSAPALVCEPGRAMVADAFSLATRVKTIRDDGSVFLNDGIYGGLAEVPVIGAVDRRIVVGPGAERAGKQTPRKVFGPTCDSLDHLPDALDLPDDIAEGDWVLFHGMGAYSTATVTRFNGYGAIDIVTTDRLH